MDGGELKEGSLVGSKGGFVGCFPGDRDVGAVDDALRFFGG
jgi:hypothetical protein